MKLSDTDLTMAERQLIENSLLRAEELLWVGKPVPRMWSPLTIIMMIMGVFFLCMDSVIILGVMGNVSLIYEPKPGMVKLRQELPGGLVNLVLGNCPYTRNKRGGLVPEGFLRLTAADAEKVLPLIRQLEFSAIP